MRFLGRRERTDQGVRRTRESFFGRIARLLQSGAVTEETWEELEEALIGSDVGVKGATELVQRSRKRAEGGGGPEPALAALKQELLAVLGDAKPEAARLLGGGTEAPRPLVVLVVGVNGSGKTTSIAKLARMFQGAGQKVLLGAGDTFRAAAIEQLEAWGQRLGVEVVAHKSGGDTAAVAFDAFRAGQARGADAVIIDTAGRLHTKHNLMEELRKVRRVLQRLDAGAPHLTLLVLDATTGQNGLAQARAFTDAVACDGVFLAKLDGTAKGGIVFAIRQELGLPVLFIGTGEDAEDVSPFDPAEFVDALLSPPPVAMKT